jgi:hypothetical protein
LNTQLSSDNGASWLTATTEYSEQALVASGKNVTAVAPSSPGIGFGATVSGVGGGAMELVTRNDIVTPWTPFTLCALSARTETSPVPCCIDGSNRMTDIFYLVRRKVRKLLPSKGLALLRSWIELSSPMNLR